MFGRLPLHLRFCLHHGAMPLLNPTDSESLKMNSRKRMDLGDGEAKGEACVIN
jgi:hypothetical protein